MEDKSKNLVQTIPERLKQKMQATKDGKSETLNVYN